MDGKKMMASDLAAELCADLNREVDVEVLAQAVGKNPNTVYCFGYKTKAQAPSLPAFILELDAAQEAAPGVVVQVVKRLAARYGIYAESLEALGREVGRRK